MKFIILLLFFVALLSPACKRTNWDQADFDSALSREPVFGHLHGTVDTMFLYEDNETKDTCGIACVDEKDSTDLFSPTIYYPCHAILDSGRLHIDIGINTLLGGSGFTIDYSDKRFRTSLYRWSDTPTPEREQEVVYQHLTLDKGRYQLGDSLYGKIDFEITTTESGHQGKNRSQSIFRTKITAGEWRVVDGKRVLFNSHLH